MRECVYSSVRMGLYDYFRGVVAPPGTRKEDFTLWHKITAGVLSGALGSSIATPIDLMKGQRHTHRTAHTLPHPTHPCLQPS